MSAETQGPIRVLIGHKISQDNIEIIGRVSPRVVLDFSKDEAEDDKKWPECEVLASFRIPTDPAKAPNLKWVQNLGTGVDHLLGTPMMKSAIPITTASGIIAVPVAEYVFAAILALCKRFPYLFQLHRDREWVSFWDIQSEKLEGKTIGIVGYGKIGRAVARIASGFGMHILASKRDPSQRAYMGYRVPGQGDPEGVLPERYFGPSQVRDMLRESDFVVLTPALTSETERMMGEGEFQAMKPSAYLVNVGRGKLLVEEAFFKAIKERQIAGAALDVFEVEPLPSDSKLYDLENVILTPHCSNMEGSADHELWSLFSENLRRYLEGEPFINEIDKAVGY